MKRLIYCLDGTANEYNDGYATNVVIMDKSISEDDNGIKQLKYYHPGVGTKMGEAFRGGAFGYGLLDNIMDSYKDLCENYELGDEIYIFGFSRGAFTARSLAGLIGCCGIIDTKYLSELDKVREYYKHRLTKDKYEIEEFNQWRMEKSIIVCANDEDYNYRKKYTHKQETIPNIINIKYIGVWDTVKSIGIFKKYEWHDAKLSPYVEQARHAMALDERRKDFNITKWNNIKELNVLSAQDNKEEHRYQQLWFPGTHGSVGGGGVHRGLSDEAFQWIREGAKQAGLKFIDNGDAEIFLLDPNPLDWLYNSTGENDTLTKKTKGLFFKSFYTIRGKIDRDGPTSLDELHRSVYIRYLSKEKHLPEKELYRPKSLSKLENELSSMDAIYEEEDYALLSYSHENKKNEEDGTIINLNGKAFYTYFVKKGDTLSQIAKKLTGNSSNYIKIQEANKVSIPDANTIYISQRIYIPLTLLSK